MECGGVVQADQLAEVRKSDAFAVTGDLFEDRERAAERLDADPLAVVCVVVDIGLDRLYQPRKRGLARAGRFFTGLLPGTRSQRINLHATVAFAGQDTNTR